MRGVAGRGGGDGAGGGPVFLPFALRGGFDDDSTAVPPATFSLMDGRCAGVACCAGGTAGRGVGGTRDGTTLAGAGGTAARGCAARSAASRVLLIRAHSVRLDVECHALHAAGSNSRLSKKDSKAKASLWT